MYYNRLPIPKVKSYKDLNSYNHLPQGAKVEVIKPKPHCWIKMYDGWYNTDPDIKEIIKLEFNEYPKRSIIKKIFRNIIGG
jgi:hypothetical protein